MAKGFSNWISLILCCKRYNQGINKVSCHVSELENVVTNIQKQQKPYSVTGNILLSIFDLTLSLIRLSATICPKAYGFFHIKLKVNISLFETNEFHQHLRGKKKDMAKIFSIPPSFVDKKAV